MDCYYCCVSEMMMIRRRPPKLGAVLLRLQRRVVFVDKAHVGIQLCRMTANCVPRMLLILGTFISWRHREPTDDDIFIAA